MNSCEEALSGRALSEEQILAARPLCLKKAEELGSEELAALLQQILRSEYRLIEARDVTDLVRKHNGRALLRLNAIRAGRFRDPEVGVSMADMDAFIAEARRLDDRVSLSYLLYKRGHRSYLEEGDRDQIDRDLREALEIARAEEVFYVQRFILSGMGYMAQDAGEYASAISAFGEMADIRLVGDTFEEIAWPHKEIGRIFYSLGAYEEAISHYATAQRMVEESGRPVAEIHDVGLRYETARAYAALGNWQAAEKEYADALMVANEYGNSTSYEQVLHDGYARSLHALGKIEAAIEAAEAAAAFNGARKARLQSARTLGWLSGIHMEDGNIAAAREAVFRAKSIMEADDNTLTDMASDSITMEAVYDYATYMGDVLLHDGNVGEAQAYDAVALDIGRKLLEQRNTNAIVNVQSLLEVREAQKQLGTLSAQADLDAASLKALRLQNILFLALAALVAVLAIASFQMYRSQRKLAVTRSIYLSEIHHRTKNNLQILSSLLSMTARRSKTPKDPRSLQQDAANRALAMALVHEHIYNKEYRTTRTRVDVKPFLEELVSLLKGSLGNESIQVDTRIVSAMVDVDRFTPLGLIVCELVTNAYKHAFDETGGTISVSLEAQAETLVLTVRDTGKGFEGGSAEWKDGSLGLGLIEDLTAQLDCEMTVTTGSDGTTWRLASLSRGWRVDPKSLTPTYRNDLQATTH